MPDIASLSIHQVQDFNAGRGGPDQKAVAKGSLSNLAVAVSEDITSRLQGAGNALPEASKVPSLASRKTALPQGKSADSVQRFVKMMKSGSKPSGGSTRLNALKRQRSDRKSSDKKDDAEDDALDLCDGDELAAYALLVEAADSAENDREQGEYEEAAERLFKKHSREITAALNTVDECEGAGTGLEPSDNARVYSNVACNFSSPREMLSYLTENFAGNFNEGMDFLVKALSADLNSINPSQGLVQLQAVGQGLDQTKVLYSGMTMMENFLSRLRDVHEIDTQGLSGMELLGRLMTLAEGRLINQLDLRNLFSEVKGRDPEQEVHIAQEFMETLRRCSTQLFPSAEAQGNIIGVAQRLVDEAIEAEDQWLEQN